MGDLKDLEGFLKELEDGVFTRRTKQSLGDEAIDIVRNRTKTGRGVSSDTSRSPSTSKLKDVSPGYSKWRAENPGGGSFAAKGRKSNLTYTGQMLDAIISRVTAKGFQLSVSNSSRRDDNLTNKKLAEKVAKDGRPFFALTKDEQQIIRKMVDDIVRGELKKLTSKYF